HPQPRAVPRLSVRHRRRDVRRWCSAGRVEVIDESRYARDARLGHPDVDRGDARDDGRRLYVNEQLVWSGKAVEPDVRTADMRRTDEGDAREERDSTHCAH